MRGPQLGQARNQLLRGEQRQDSQPQPQDLPVPRHHLDRVGQAVDDRRDQRQQPLTVRVQDKHVMPPIEQRLADEPFERLQATTERGRRQRQCLRRRLDRSRARDGDERLDPRQ